LASLDASKAFDRVDNVKLFHSRCDIGVPIHVVKLVMNWCANIASVRVYTYMYMG